MGVLTEQKPSQQNETATRKQHHPKEEEQEEQEEHYLSPEVRPRTDRQAGEAAAQGS